MGFWTDITKIDAPATADFGQVVNVGVNVKNKTPDPQWIVVTGYYNSGAFSQPVFEIGAGQTAVFPLTFTMPNHDITLQLRSYIWVIYPDQPGYWQDDDFKTLNIGLIIAGWTRLATLTAALSVSITAGWIRLAIRAIILPVSISAGWTRLATLTVPLIVSVTAGWTYLATLTAQLISVPSGEPPPNGNGEPPGEAKNILPFVLLAGGAGIALAAVAKPKGKSIST